MRRLRRLEGVGPIVGKIVDVSKMLVQFLRRSAGSIYKENWSWDTTEIRKFARKEAVNGISRIEQNRQMQPVISRCVLLVRNMVWLAYRYQCRLRRSESGEFPQYIHCALRITQNKGLWFFDLLRHFMIAPSFSWASVGQSILHSASKTFVDPISFPWNVLFSDISILGKISFTSHFPHVALILCWHSQLAGQSDIDPTKCWFESHSASIWFRIWISRNDQPSPVKSARK